MKITTGKRLSSPTVMLFGLPGAGKSTLASTLPRPIFLDIEDGLKYIDAAKTERPITSCDELIEDILELGRAAKNGKREFDYVVIDSVDWAVRLFTTKITGSGQVKGGSVEKLMESARGTLNRGENAYGNGRMVLENFIRDLFIHYLKGLNSLGYGIVLIAHADRKSVMESDGTNIDRITPKMDLTSMNAFIEWVDNLFYIRKDDDGTRNLVVNPTDVIMAKNRIGLQEDEFVMDDKFDLHSLITTGKAQKAGNANKE